MVISPISPLRLLSLSIVKYEYAGGMGISSLSLLGLLSFSNVKYGDVGWMASSLYHRPDFPHLQ